MRAVFIALGPELLETFDFIVYVFGTLVIATGVRMAAHSTTEIHPSATRSPPAAQARRHHRRLSRPAMNVPVVMAKIAGIESDDEPVDGPSAPPPAARIAA